VFFETAAALVSRDVNGKTDVYEWQNGRAALISSGSGSYASSFLDASADGQDVFFATRDRLVSTDRDDVVDAYDARVGGGFADPGEDGRQACSGDGCQGELTPEPVLAVAASVTFAGSGNVAPAPSTSRPAKVSVTKKATVTGTRARVRVRVPAKGGLAVSGSGLKTAKRSVAKGGTYTLTISLSTGAQAALRRHGSLKVKARVRFTPAVGPSSTVSLTLTFKASSIKKGR
jgi:hypothetical protein